MKLLNRMTQSRSAIASLVLSLCVKVVLAEEKGPSVTSVSMAATLIGSVSFIMLLYYFTNWPDEDIQEKSYDTISSTISIFCAVLLFSSFNDMVQTYIIKPIYGEGDATEGALLVDMCHMTFWFIAMQIALAWMSGAAGPWAIKEEVFEEYPIEKKEEILDEKEANMKCFAVLLAHITGFASINAFATLQAMYFNDTPAKALLVVPIVFVFMIVVQRITDRVRTRVAKGDDGKMDEFEKLWDEETEESENDVMGLALSFTCMSAVRFAITNCLPNQEGKEEECGENALFSHSSDDKCMLLGAALAWALLLFLVRMFWPSWAEESYLKKLKGPENKAKRKMLQKFARTFEGISCAVAMCFSWAMFYGTQMLLAGFDIFKGEDELLSVCLAMVLSLTMMVGLLPLDKLADAKCTGPAVDRGIRSLMDGMALVIGFAWEQCFDTSVDALAEKANESDNDMVNEHTAKLGLSIFCASLLVPAWRWYIIPFMIKKGWEIPHALTLIQLERAAERLIAIDKREEEEEEEGEGTERAVHPEKLKKFVDMFMRVHDHGCKNIKKGTKPELPVLAVPPPIAPVAAINYQPLPGDEVEALKSRNKELVDELAKAKNASIKAQQMLDTTMESMMQSMKHMHETVGRIEQSA